MAALRPSGGSGRRYQLAWQGATVERQIDAGVQKALGDEAREIAADLKATLHRWPLHTVHHLADDSFAVVSVAGTKRTLRLGSDAPYAYWHETGSSNYAAHPQIRAIADKHAPHITARLKAALGSSR